MHFDDGSWTHGFIVGLMQIQATCMHGTWPSATVIIILQRLLKGTGTALKSLGLTFAYAYWSDLIGLSKTVLSEAYMSCR